MESNSRPKPPEVLLSSAALRECSLSNLHAVVASKDCDIKIPVIDMSAPKEDIARQLWSAAQSVGFFTVINLVYHNMILRSVSTYPQSFLICRDPKKKYAHSM